MAQSDRFREGGGESSPGETDGIESIEDDIRAVLTAQETIEDDIRDLMRRVQRLERELDRERSSEKGDL